MPDQYYRPGCNGVLEKEDKSIFGLINGSRTAPLTWYRNLQTVCLSLYQTSLKQARDNGVQQLYMLLSQLKLHRRFYASHLVVEA
ncbi:hypothetical protein ACLB2K_022166 [Fragaria x ananassa]